MFTVKDHVTNCLEEMKKKGYQRRYIFSGWNNYTEFERQGIQKVKQMLTDEFNIDFNKSKPFGPRVPDGKFVQGKSDILPGIDPLMDDIVILRLLVTRAFDYETVKQDLLFHLEWRQTNKPIT